MVGVFSVRLVTKISGEVNLKFLPPCGVAQAYRIPSDGR